MADRELHSLIRLLDDPDEEIYDKVRTQLISRGEPVIPKLETAWEEDPFGLHFRNRVEDIIQRIQFNEVKKALHQWDQEEKRQLMDGATILCRYQYPDLDEQNLTHQVEKIRKDVWLEMNDKLTSFEKVHVINQILFETHGFRGNTTNYQAPQNNYLNDLLESKKGNTLSLSMLYILVAQSAGVPVFGVNLPGHFILAYLDENNVLALTQGYDTEEKVLFYINPFSQGGIFNKEEIDNFLQRSGIEPAREYFEPCSNRNIIKRGIDNLVEAYEKKGYEEKVAELKELAEVMERKSTTKH